MISLLKGKIIENADGKITVLTAGGVGYDVAVNIMSASKWPIGDEAEVLTYLVVRETSLDLYGFADDVERSLFLQFLEVSGIGPKTALHILSLGSAEDIAGAIARGDVDYLTKVSGVGKKTAERIVVELRNKMGAVGKVKGGVAFGGPVGDAVEGLVSMGYTNEEARDAVKKIDAAGKTSEQILREALKRVK
ncbi:MAG: Holliday junction branch migration protein RuvA [bacterium]|nr:Holliday junction branch migration protein RuvA [bacterium]